MKNALSNKELIQTLDKLATDLAAHADELRELDAKIGDGDLGITVTLGFEAVQETLMSLGDSDASAILLRTGMAFNRKAASTFGALYATMMMRAAKAVKGKEKLGLEEFADMFEAAVEGVQERGKADVGDKTMLDALVPAAAALRAAFERGDTLAEGMEQAARAAQNGMLATIDMKSKMGRASWFSDRTIGCQDPGATAIYYIFLSLSESLA